jgi:hypothetical protein
LGAHGDETDAEVAWNRSAEQGRYGEGEPLFKHVLED